MSINKEKVNELLDGFDIYNPEDLTNIVNLTQYVYRTLTSRSDMLKIGRRIIEKLDELDGLSGVTIEDSIVTTNEGKELKVKDMLDFIQKELNKLNNQ